LYIAPILPRFLDRYPSINLELRLSDTQVNLIEGAFDLALRNYAIEESNLRARKLADDQRILCASPDYLQRFGMPQTPEDLAHHQFVFFMSGPSKRLNDRHGEVAGSFPPDGAIRRVVCDDGASMRLATKAGAGIAMNSMWSVRRDLDDGSLLHVLPDYEIDDPSAIWLVYPKANVLTAKVRAFIDFLLEEIGDPPVWES
jgi:DNA-binding transcriptional LysR family regulator